MNRYRISYIQYGNIPARNSPPHPTPCPPQAASAGGPAWGGVGCGGGESLMGIVPYRIL